MELLPTKQQKLFESNKRLPKEEVIKTAKNFDPKKFYHDPEPHILPKNPKSAPEILNSKKGRIIKAVVDDKLVFEGD